MYADDTVLAADSAESLQLQKLLDGLSVWTANYGLNVNVDKSKVMVFRSSWRMRNEQFYYNGNRKNREYLFISLIAFALQRKV